MTYNLASAPSLTQLWHGRARWIMLCYAAMLGSAPVYAQVNIGKIFCTNAPRSQWTSEAQARERFRASDYVLVKYKISSGNCHEFYAVDAQGTVVESYLHPITGETVRTTRVPAPTAPIPAKP